MRLYDVFMTDMTSGEEVFISVTAESVEDAKGFARNVFGSCVNFDAVLVPETPRVFRMDDASEEVKAEYDAYLRMVQA